MRAITLFSVGTLWLLSGCAATSHEDRDYVEAQIAQRTGHAIAPEAASNEPVIPQSVSVDDGLSEDEAVAIALWNNAAFREVMADLGFSRADIIQAGMLTNPTFWILFPLGPKQVEFAAKLPVEALLLRSKRLEVARFDADRTAEVLVQSGLDVVRDVRVAYTDAVLMTNRARLADDALAVSERIAELTEARLKEGDTSVLDATTARTDALLARDEARRAAADLTLAQQRLKLLMGVSQTEEFTLQRLAVGPALSIDVETLTQSAWTARPDLRAAELAIDAARARTKLSRWGWLTFALIGDANGQGAQGFESGPGIEFGIPIFDHGQGATARAHADLERAQRRYTTVRETIAFEVVQAYARFLQASAQVDMWRSGVVPQLEQSVRRAESAYADGETSLLLVLETVTRLLKVRARELDVTAELCRARAELERSVGGKLELDTGGAS